MTMGQFVQGFRSSSHGLTEHGRHLVGGAPAAALTVGSSIMSCSALKSGDLRL